MVPALNGAKRLTWGEAEDPAVDNPSARVAAPVQGRRRERRDDGGWTSGAERLGIRPTRRGCRGRARFRRSERTRLVSLSTWSASTSLRDQSRCFTEHPGRCRDPRRPPRVSESPSPESWSSDRELSRAKSARSTLPPAEISALTPGGRSNITSLGGATMKASGSPAGRRLGSVYGIVGLDLVSPG